MELKHKSDELWKEITKLLIVLHGIETQISMYFAPQLMLLIVLHGIETEIFNKLC